MTEHTHAFHAHTNDDDPTDVAFELMAAGVPLSLLLDLATPLHSRDTLVHEPGDSRWLVAV